MSYRADINLNGGGNTARYFASLAYVEDQGMYNTDETLRKKYNTNANYKLASIANEVGQKQNEKIVYPSIREQLSAIKTLMSIKGWEEELLVLQQSISVQQNSMDNQEILSVKTMDTTSVVNEKTESKEEFIAPSIEKEAVLPLKEKDELPSTLKKGDLSSTLKKGKLQFAPTTDDPIASLPACWRNAFG